MACRGKVLVAVVAVFLGLIAEQQVTFVNGDRQLVQNVCSKTPNPTACNDCLTSFSNVYDLNLEYLGRLAVNCASRDSKKAVQLLSDASDLDPSETCLPRLQDGDRQITNALESLTERRFADAANQVQAGAFGASECSDALQNYGSGAAVTDIINQIAKLKTDRDVAAAILRQIH